MLEKTAADAKAAEVVVAAAVDTSEDAPVVAAAVHFGITVVGSNPLNFDATVEKKLIIAA